jgi:ascorbate-specific PTS system EIIC-type component UlaA
MNAKLTLLKKATLSAVIGHGAALLFLFLSSAVLVKNENPSSMMPIAAIVAFFIGAAVCGVIAGRSGNGLWDVLAAGLIFSLLIIVISLLLNAVLPTVESESGYGLGSKVALVAGGLVVSTLVGLWITSRKNSSRTSVKRRKKALDKYINE